MKRLLLMFAAAPLTCSTLRAKEWKRVDEQEARALVAEYLKGVRPGKAYRIHLSPFGDWIWQIHCYRRIDGLSAPPVVWRHVMGPTGKVYELTLEGLNSFFVREYPPSPTEENRRRLMADFVSLHSGGSIINGTPSIPGYDKSPLDPDIAEAVRAPFSFGNVSVVYAYTQMRGLLHRYRFRFANGGVLGGVECAELGRDVGDAHAPPRHK